MLHRIREAKKNESGFTLIELLIVIVILGILAAVVVFSVSGLTDRGSQSACQADVATVTTAGESYIAKNGTPATDIPALVTAGLLHSAPGDVTYALVAGPPASFIATGKAGSACAGFTD
jgi:general secretion pathway protein G